MTPTQLKIKTKAEKIQKDLHTAIIYSKNKGTIADYQDIVTAFLISKLASLEVALEKKQFSKENLIDFVNIVKNSNNQNIELLADAYVVCNNIEK